MIGVPLALLCAALALNLWVGYFPTVRTRLGAGDERAAERHWRELFALFDSEL